jgi:hypothetical protein
MRAGISACFLVLLVGANAPLPAAAAPPPGIPAAFDTLSARGMAADRLMDRRMPGRSGALRVSVVDPSAELEVYLDGGPGAALEYRWVPLHGTASEVERGILAAGTRLRAPEKPGFWRLETVGTGAGELPGNVEVVTRVPIGRKREGVLNGYRIGRYPAAGSERYAAPTGFIEVTPENQDVPISENFRLRQFLTKDQFDVWPKYVALDPRLLDKLELVLLELRSMGVHAERMTVMSGFRTPLYNGPGGNGRARHSRHTYGDAADVWVDNDGSGWISDLNGDGFRDIEDARIILRAVDRVEDRYPELVGGAGIYFENPVRGPFVHIDVRGTRVRW